jgi:hypothetical protein
MDNYNFRAKSVLIANLIDFKRKSKNWILGKIKRNVVLRRSKHNDHFWVSEKLDGLTARYLCAFTDSKKRHNFGMSAGPMPNK